MSDRPKKPKTIKCPECGCECSHVDMSPKGMWGIGEFQEIAFRCVHCGAQIARFEHFLDVTAEGILMLSRCYADSRWADKYYMDEEGGGE